MTNPYIEEKALRAALVISKKHGMDPVKALDMTREIWQEARRSILTMSEAENWKKLAFREKAAVCEAVVRSLLDEKRVEGFLTGDIPTIV